MSQAIYRYHYRGQLKAEVQEADLKQALEEAKRHIKELVKAEKIMTAALYHFNHMLFFYYEAIGEEQEPEELLAALTPYLELWPGQETLRHWVYMYHIYYHAIPESVADWRRERVPQMRRGRIAFLKKDKLFDYVYHHIAIVKEGLLEGDKYQSIGIHENVLFSYFEEPRSHVNIRREPGMKSKEIDAWEALDPKSHFIPGPEGTSFTFIPALLLVGEEMV